ncbi:hypothetical protein DRO53_03445 [Candidatus Bathyarchaeota archaeon]|nr:MAG: hypothetical protein DRO53_03445 [Candidatus Bathyarchaeota archaeon]
MENSFPLEMARAAFNPNAYLPNFKNRRAGLKARTLILDALGKHPSDIETLRSETGLSTSSLRYHLRLLESRRLVRKIRSGRRVTYELTGLGQQPIIL